jgi:hypothetical protein
MLVASQSFKTFSTLEREAAVSSLEEICLIASDLSSTEKLIGLLPPEMLTLGILEIHIEVSCYVLWFYWRFQLS